MSNENTTTYDVLDVSSDGMSTEKAKHSKKTLGRMVKALKPQKWSLLVAFTFAIAGVILNLWAPLVFADAINVIFAGIEPMLWGIGPIAIDMRQLGGYVLLLTGVYALVSVLLFCQEYIMASVGQKLVVSLRREVAAKLARVPLKFYDTHKKGEILSRVTNDLERVNEIIKDAIMRLFTSALTIVGAMILMFRINWILTLIAIATVLLGFGITAIVSVYSNKYFSARQRSLGIFNTRIEEYFSGQVEVKTFTMEKEANTKTNAAIHDLYKDDKKAQFIMFVIMPVMRLFNQVGYVVIAALGAAFVIQGRFSIGHILSFSNMCRCPRSP